MYIKYKFSQIIGLISGELDLKKPKKEEVLRTFGRAKVLQASSPPRFPLMNVTYMIDHFDNLKTLKRHFIVSFLTDSKLEVFMMICVEKENWLYSRPLRND